MTEFAEVSFAVSIGIFTLVTILVLLTLFFPRRKPTLTYPFKDMIGAMKEKDSDLYARVGCLPVAAAWRAWKEVYPEDFPQGGASPATAASIMPRDHMSPSAVNNALREIMVEVKNR